LFIYATVERDGGDSLLSYNIVDLNEDETSFIVEPERLRNKRAEEAIEKVGGTVRTPQKA
jgi:acyl carrier protein